MAEGGTHVDLEVREDGWITRLDSYSGFPHEVAKGEKGKAASKDAFGEPLRFDCFGEGLSYVEHRGAVMIATFYLEYSTSGSQGLIDVSNLISGIRDAKHRTCRRAQFDDAAYEAFQRAHEGFVARISSMELSELKTAHRTDPEFARAFDMHLTAARRLKSELE